MDDLDAQINRLSGQTNYMEKLQQLTGNIYTIDRDMYKTAIKKISAAAFNIGFLLTKLKNLQSNETVLKLLGKYTKLEAEMDLKNSVFVMVQKKSSKKVHPPKEKIAHDRTPPDLIKSEWFTCIKSIERAIYKFICSFTTSSPRTAKYVYPEYSVLEKHFTEEPTQLELKTVFDIKVNSGEIYNTITKLHEMAYIIIDQLMTPMYNVRQTIESHWGQIAQIFTQKALQNHEIFGDKNMVIDVLHKFIIAKYRAEITGNKKHYVKLFMSTVDEGTMAEMDSARFIEIMDSIDLEKLNKKEKVYKFAMAAKSTMKALSENENINVEEVIEKLNNLFESDDEAEKEEITEADKEVMEQVDEII